MLPLLRCLLRCAGFGFIGVVLPIDWLFSIVLTGRRRDHPARAALLHRWARFTCRLVGCDVIAHGPPPATGLCVSNHVSYLDIAAYGATTPMLFVSKHDVIYWPLFGQWAAMCGTLFLKRERRGHVADVGDQMAEVLVSRVPLMLFPEGTSSDGESVLPFKSSLFQPAIAHQWTVTPMRVRYELADGSVSREVAYWGEMTLLPHLLHLLTKKSVRAVITFGVPLPPGQDRKELCQRARDAVLAL